MTQTASVTTSAADWLDAMVANRTREWHPNAARVTLALARSAPIGGNVTPILGGFGGQPTSILSRYMRAGLPSPKQQLVLFRLALAVAIKARGATTATSIAFALDYSSSQSFHRHVRDYSGRPCGIFLARWNPEAFCLESVAPVLKWDDDRWTTFDPLEGSGRRSATNRLADYRARALLCGGAV